MIRISCINCGTILYCVSLQGKEFCSECRQKIEFCNSAPLYYCSICQHCYLRKIALAEAIEVFAVSGASAI